MGGFAEFLRLSDMEEFFPSCFIAWRSFVGIINIYFYKRKAASPPSGGEASRGNKKSGPVLGVYAGRGSFRSFNKEHETAGKLRPP